MPRRREQQPGAPRLDDLSDGDLVRLRYFSQCPRYTLDGTPADRARLYELLEERGLIGPGARERVRSALERDRR